MSSGEKCQRCGELGEDRRTIRMDCFYDMEELDIPLEQEVLLHADIKDLKKKKDPTVLRLDSGKSINLGGGTVTTKGELRPQNLYTMRVCKKCRADWMDAIKHWFEHCQGEPESCGSGIYVRRNGATVEISEEEWSNLHPDREPCRVKKTMKLRHRMQSFLCAIGIHGPKIFSMGWLWCSHCYRNWRVS